MRPNPFPIAQTITPAVFGANAARFWSFGEAPQTHNPNDASQYPYAVWQHIVGIPYNSLPCPPNLWQNTIQIDIYAKTPQSCVTAAEATVSAFADAGMIGSVRDWPREPETKLYRYTIEVDLN
jgi:hypothetical protein